MIGFYIHIPFCNSICTYCDFPKRISANQSMKEEYIHSLMEEIKSYEPHFKSVQTLYIGGGTPNSLSLELLSQLFSFLSQRIDLKALKEFTIEINPECLTKDQAELFGKYYVSRVSIGAQTFDETVLQKIHRKHTSEDIHRAIKLCHENGLKNVNLDLMYNLPGQNLKSIKNDLRAVKMNRDLIQHISYYSLILEEKTILAHQGFHQEEEKELQMMRLISRELKKMGYEQYEISNYCKMNRASLHNQIYWKNQEYIGAGSGASGYLEGVRYSNTKNVSSYIQNYQEGRSYEYLTSGDQRIYEMIMGLRLLKGVSRKEFFRKYGMRVEDAFQIQKLYQSNLIIDTKDRIHLTKKGLYLANLVFEAFV